MDITKTIVPRVSVPYKITDGRLIYMDILIFTEIEFQKLSDADIDAQITEKFTIWRDFVNTPTVPLTKAEMQAQLTQAEKEKTELETKITLLIADIAK